MAKKNTKRGFTLVELIVVLVILAILAALLIPALTGYIDKARKSQVVAETRMLTQAVQTEMSTIYGLNNSFKGQKDIGKPLTIASKTGVHLNNGGAASTGDLGNLKEHYEEIVHLSEVPALEKGLTASNDAYFYSFIDKNGAVMWTVYDNGEGYIGIYCGDDGKIDSFKSSEVENAGDYKDLYAGYVIYYNERDAGGLDPFSKEAFYALLGIENN
jgi:prepilin-type N-terminal cleavage/methylation domain-containing protein